MFDLIARKGDLHETAVIANRRAAEDPTRLLCALWAHGRDSGGPLRSPRSHRSDHHCPSCNAGQPSDAGASLPLLILFSVGGVGLGNVLNGELVAEEVVRTLAGSIELAASVPITTYLAAVIVTRRA